MPPQRFVILCPDSTPRSTELSTCKRLSKFNPAEVHKHINKLLACVGKQNFKLHTCFYGRSYAQTRPKGSSSYIYIYIYIWRGSRILCMNVAPIDTQTSMQVYCQKKPLSLSTQGLASGHTFAPSLSCKWIRGRQPQCFGSCP